MKHRFRLRRHSLSRRLFWLFLMMAVVFVVLVGGTMGLAFKYGFEEKLRPHLVRYLEYVQADIGLPPDLQKTQTLVERLPVEIHIFGPGWVWSSTDRPPDLSAITDRHGFVHNGVAYQVGKYRDQEYLVNHRGDYTFAFSIPNTRGPLHWRLLVPIGILLLVLMLLHHTTRKLLRPIETLNSGVQRIGQGDLDFRVEIDRRDELGDLAKSVNAMADDIKRMLEAKRQLLLAISHELRSPVTRAKVSLEMLEDADMRAELNRELDEIEKLVSELLETERLSTGHRVLNKTNTSINQLVLELLKRNFDAVAINIAIPDENIDMSIDVVRVRLLLKNLLDNAIRYNGGNLQPPKLSIARCAGGVQITVRDFGDGIDAAHLPYLTEPFYRVDRSRQRQTGGYGLGLYLCRVIAQAHGGDLEISSEKGKGTNIAFSLSAESD